MGKARVYMSKIRQVVNSVQTIGVTATVNKIKQHLKYRNDSPVLDLMLLKPVKKKWKETKKLKHKYDISVIIPTYNRSHMLEDLIESWKEVNKVTKYTYEIIFSDDGSSDGSVDILKNVHGLPIKVLANEHGGAAKARNAAIYEAQGEKLFIIGDDIFPNKNILNQHYEKLQELEITDAILGECKWHPDLKVNHLMDHITLRGCEQFSFEYLPKNSYTDFRHFYTCNISIDREFLLSEEIIFDESFYKVNFEDIELGYRLAKKGMKVYYYPEARGNHLHAYTDVDKFCNRQETAGEMALVFKKLHEEIEPILNINDITLKWSQYLDHDDGEKDNLYDQIILFCQYIEDNFITKESNLSDDLSVIYIKLFRFAYEKGVCQQSINITNHYLNKVFLNEFFSNKFRQSLSDLNALCEIPNYERIISLTSKQSKSKQVLTLEAIDLEHLNELVNRYESFAEVLQFSLKSEIATNGLIYRPEKGFYINKNNMDQILLFLQTHFDIDFVFLSFGLFDLPNIGIVNTINNSCISNQKHTFEQKYIDIKNMEKGKIIRIFEHFEADKIPFQTLFYDKLDFFDDYGYYGKESFSVSNINKNIVSLNKENSRPVIFVFPIFLAVGGVERNTVEIINQLKNKYDFVSITFERLDESHGSLHHQFLNECIGLYDLTELSSHALILNFLEVLDKMYNPQLIWVCNGSPWLAGNTMNIRNLFSSAAIVDQQVYDTEVGWVQLYKGKNNGLLSFDRFIAINSKIKDVFVTSVDIDIKNIDLIYSVMSTEKRTRAITTPKEEIYNKFNLNTEEKYFVFIGRLTEQKAPLDFLKVIRSIVDIHGTSYKFVMVGNGELNNKIIKYIEKHGLSNHIVKFDYIENTFELSMIAEAIVFTSLFEGLSIALLEALSVGTPGISTDVGDTKLIFNTYINGITFKTIGDTNEYLSVFNEFIDNYGFYKENAENNKNEIAKRFSAENIALQYIECFEAAIEQRKGHQK